MNVRRFFDWVQLRLHLSGFHGLAMFLGRFGTPALPSNVDEGDRPTLPDPITVDDLVPEVRSGPGWSLDELPDGPVKVIDFDPTFNNNEGFDPASDLALPHTKLDIN